MANRRQLKLVPFRPAAQPSLESKLRQLVLVRPSAARVIEQLVDDQLARHAARAAGTYRPSALEHMLHMCLTKDENGGGS